MLYMFIDDDICLLFSSNGCSLVYVQHACMCNTQKCMCRHIMIIYAQYTHIHASIYAMFMGLDSVYIYIHAHKHNQYIYMQT